MTQALKHSISLCWLQKIALLDLYLLLVWTACLAFGAQRAEEGDKNT